MKNGGFFFALVALDSADVSNNKNYDTDGHMYLIFFQINRSGFIGGNNRGKLGCCFFFFFFFSCVWIVIFLRG